jgi:hypothetical protein
MAPVAHAQAVAKSVASAWLIVPGQRIGKVKIGMPRQTVQQLLGTPRSSAHLQDGALLERWASSKPSEKSLELFYLADFVTVYYRDGRVVQIDASSPSFKLVNGLSTLNSANDFAGIYPTSSVWEKKLTYLHKDDGGIPATKHFVCYDDATEKGIAWRYGWWGNLAPDGDPASPLEMISVHVPSTPALIDPDGADQFTLTTAYKEKHGYPARTLLEHPQQPHAR